MLELRRRLSYVCAASALNESNESQSNTDISRTGPEKCTKEGRLYVKSDTSSTSTQGAIKKRIRYRQKSSQSRILPDTDEEEDNLEQKRNTHKKLVRTRSISEGSTNTTEDYYKDQNQKNEIIVDESLIQKVVVPTHSNILNITSSEDFTSKPSDSPVTLFVKTTRKLFTPIVESGLSEKINEETTPSIKSNESSHVEDSAIKVTPENKQLEEEKGFEPPQDNLSESSFTPTNMIPVLHLPPLPASPVTQKKTSKDISPSIKLMLAKYNQKISEQDSPSGKSGGSSGSASPVAWRSPASERRVKAQTERYQEELNKLSPLLGERREIQKAASVGYLHKQVIVPVKSNASENNRNILKSSSVSALAVKHIEVETKKQTFSQCSNETKTALNITIDKNSENLELHHSPEIRLQKLQKAKEEFLKSVPASVKTSGFTHITSEEPIRFPTKNRLSQISVGSESSYESACTGLIKSASAGMINIDADVYKQFNPEVHGGGYVSLPRCTKKQKQVT
ncbi:hypothetical protein BDFB_008551 [Asbolus verrucosus]|uniref:Uncharacterized protein n=1 Tax=Asbolus verrucosus TaxID=1661398 RepID=A0A482WBM6_ASBVE|nr:hypothetical protein BDFB_008551 [Asbolus verrucosus]